MLYTRFVSFDFLVIRQGVRSLSPSHCLLIGWQEPRAYRHVARSGWIRYNSIPTAHHAMPTKENRGKWEWRNGRSLWEPYFARIVSLYRGWREEKSRKRHVHPPWTDTWPRCTCLRPAHPAIFAIIVIVQRGSSNDSRDRRFDASIPSSMGRKGIKTREELNVSKNLSNY